MENILMNFKIKGLNFYEDSKLEIDFITEKNTKYDDLDNGIVTKLFSSVNKLNTIELIGRNASGKTSTLDIINDLLRIYIDNTSLHKDMRLAKYFTDYIDIYSYFFNASDKRIYKIYSKINKDKDTNDLKYVEEKIYYSKITTNSTRKSIFDQNNYKLLYDRSEIKRESLINFLKDDDSIFFSINNKESKFVKVNDLLSTTNLNFLAHFGGDIPSDIFNYLDNSLEIFEVDDSESTTESSLPRFNIKFKNSNNVYNSTLTELDKYLSSGTIRGTNMLLKVFSALAFGGYLIIDEIENHLHKSIVLHIINLFLDIETNPKGATLIFSTHYAEIIESIKRSDSIYITEKDEKISVDKFSTITKNKSLDRSDKNKANVILSGILGTSPKYEYRKNLRKNLLYVLNNIDPEHVEYDK